MSGERDQLFKKRFDEFMAEADDAFEDDISVGSGVGSGARLGGLTGLRPAGGALGGTSKPTGRGGIGSLGSLPSPKKPTGGLGGLGGSSGLGSLPSPSKPTGGLGGLGGLGGRGSRGIGGLGGLGGLGSKSTSKPALARPSAPSNIVSSAQPATALNVDHLQKTLDDVVKATSNLTLEVTSSVQGIQEENTKALKDISAFIKSLTEQTLNGFKEVSNRLNQPRYEDGKLQESLDAMIKNIDEEVAAKDDVVYIIVPGRESSTVTIDEATELIKDKSVKVVGSISQLTF